MNQSPALQLWGDGVPVITRGVSEGTRYIDDSSGPPFNEYIFKAGAWVQLGASGGGNTTVTQALTSGAAPVDVTLPTDDVWRCLLVNVTSGGTGGNETVNVPLFTLDANGFNENMIGRRVVVALVTQTVGADVVLVTANSGAALQTKTENGTQSSLAIPNHLILDYAGADGWLDWTGDRWVWNNQNGNNDTVVDNTVRRPVGQSVTIGTLPTVTTNVGQIWMVNNALAPAVGAPVAAGGVALCLVCSNATDWIVVALL